MNTVTRIARRSTAAFLAVWLSGFVFLFCCEYDAAAADVEFCPLPKTSSHCDKAKTVETDAASVSSSEPVCVDCCAFLPVVFDKSRKIEPVQKQIVPQRSPAIAAAYAIPQIVRTPAPRFNVAGFVPDRHDTHLRNCVFRI